MEILLNEHSYVEKMIASKQLKELPFDLSLLVRYLYQKGLRKKKIYEYVEEFMSLADPAFDINLWYKYIDRYIIKAKKRPLFEIEYIPVTKTELESIKKVNNPQKERLLFTLLVLAKLNNLKSDTNNSWVNYPEKVIFKLARISCSSLGRDKLIYELKELGYLKNSKKIGSLNIQVLFISPGEEVLKITDMRELGYQYQELEKHSLIRRCTSCGRPYKIKSSKCRAGLCQQCKEKEQVDYVIKHCAICGTEFYCSPKDTKSYLCPKHQIEQNREQDRLRKQISG